MRNHRDETGVRNTCDYINEVIETINAIDWSIMDNYYTKDSSLHTLEVIRQATIDLREFGNEQYKRAEELEKERDELLNVVTNLELDVNYLEGLVNKE